MIALLIVAGLSLTATLNGARVECEAISAAYQAASLRPEAVTSIEIDGAVSADDLARLTTAYPNLAVLKMTPAASVTGGKIPKHCFAKSGLTEVTIFGAAKIGKGAFQKCLNLVSVEAPTVAKLGCFAFDGCRSLTKVVVDKLEKLGRNAFQDCSKMTSFVVPAGVKVLPNTAFQGCNNMAELVISGPVEAIPEEFLFGMPLLRSVGVPASVKSENFGFAETVTVKLIRPAVEGWCPETDTFKVPMLVNEIGDAVLKGCKTVKKIHIPKQIRRIGAEAFAEMDALNEVVFDEPSELVHIHDRAMANCPALTKITIPRSVKTVGKTVFLHSWALKEIFIYPQFDSEWFSEGLLSETHAKMVEIRDPVPESGPNNFDKPYRSFPLRPPQKPLTEEEKKPKHTSNKKPNVVFYFSDQQRWDSIGPNGQKLDLTPFLDQLAREGVNFANCFCNQPVCGPLRSIIQSGQYPAAIGTFKNAVPLPTDLKYRLPDQLKEAGYNIAYIGKWHLASDEDKQRYERLAVPVQFRGGWDQYWVAADVLEFTSHGYGGYLWDTDNNKREFTGYRVDSVTDYALEYIRNYDDEKPFFLFLSHIEPHQQNDHGNFEGPIGSKERFKDFEPPPDCLPGLGDWETWMPDYLGCCWSLDKNLGRIMQTLKDKGIYDDTAIFYSTDHGCHFKTRNDVEPGGGDDYKRCAYDSTLHIPLVIKGPGFEGGKVVNQYVSTINLAPTIMRMVGGQPGPDWKGRPLQEVDSADWENIIYAQISESFVGRAIRTEKYNYVIHAAGKNPYKEPGSDKLTWTDKHLYDLEKDPQEWNDLKDNPDYNEIKAELRKILIRKAQEAGEGTFKIVDNNPVTGDL